MGTGDWNDGMNRVGEGGQGRERVAGLVLPCRSRPSSRSPRPATNRRAPRPGRRMPMRWAERSIAKAGTATGIAAATTTTARRSARQRARNAASIPSPSPGRPSRAPAIRRARSRRWRRSTASSCTAAIGWRCCSRRRSTRPPLDPGYIKGYPPGIRENGGQYTHAAAWSIMGFAALGQGDKAAELFSLINPINHTATRAGVLRYKVEPYVVGRRRLFGGAACRAGRLDLVHGFGRLALPGRRRIDSRPARSKRGHW